MTVTSPAFEPKVPVSVVHDVGRRFVFPGGGDPAVSDRSVKCAGFRELLPGDCSVIVRGFPGS